ncbi:MAG: RNA polymerase sigma factor [Planctomycetota bacterium]|jgi:RNA polymerase sigma-70 factor (ECF subfamily)
MLEDKRLVKKLNGGDGEALRKVYDKYKDDLLSIACALLHDNNAAEDVLHDVFISLARSAGRLEMYGTLKNYLITCVVNRVRDMFRKKMYQVVEIERIGPSASQTATPEESVIFDEEAEYLTQALNKLPLTQREVIILHLQGGLRFREIADIQNISINTVQGRYRYGLDKLRTLLSDKI